MAVTFKCPEDYNNTSFVLWFQTMFPTHHNETFPEARSKFMCTHPLAQIGKHCHFLHLAQSWLLPGSSYSLHMARSTLGRGVWQNATLDSRKHPHLVILEKCLKEVLDLMSATWEKIILCSLAQIGKNSLSQPSKYQINAHSSSSLIFASSLDGCLALNYILGFSKRLLTVLFGRL